MRFVASAPSVNLRALNRQTPLIVTEIEQTATGPVARYVPVLAEPWHEHCRIQFPHWWDEELVFRDSEAVLTRKKLVFTLRSQEGGTHLDDEVQNPYFEKMSYESLTTPMLLAEGQAARPILGAEYATMRQIAWELTTTLNEADPIT